MEVQKIVKVLTEDFAMSGNVNQRLGGLTAIGAVAVALGKVRKRFREQKWSDGEPFKEKHLRNVCRKGNHTF